MNTLLYELKNTRQIAGENNRRWFTSLDMDLIIWYDSTNIPVNFELCYNKQTAEHALRWTPSGIEHHSVDSGENSPGKYKATPVLRENSHFDSSLVLRQFKLESAQLPHEITSFVLTVLKSCP